MLNTGTAPDWILKLSLLVAVCIYLDFYHQVESPNRLPKVDFAGCSTSTIYSSQSWECMSYVSCGFDSGSHHGMWKMRENVIRYNLILKWWREGGGEKFWFKRKTFQNFLKRFYFENKSSNLRCPMFWRISMEDDDGGATRTRLNPKNLLS